MAFDTLDITVLVAIAVAIVAYFGKDFIWSDSSNQGGFITNTGDSDDRNIVQMLKKNDKNTIIFYGSQTGTAEDYSSKLSKELRARFGLKTVVVDFADYDYDNFHELPEDTLCFFLVATYGEGEPTDNAVEFYNYLDEATESLSFKFSVFGLGNSTYEFYNAMGKKADERLESLGAGRFAPYGAGDDGVGTMDEDYITWKEEVFDSLKNNLSMDEHELKYEPGLKLIEDTGLTKNDKSVSLGEPDKTYLSKTADLNKGPFGHNHPYLSQISYAKELFNSKERSCVHAEFDISESNLRYSTGDHLAIWPSNANENVDKFLKAFDLTSKADKVFELKALDTTISILFPTPITFEAAIKHHLEITGSISRQFLVSIAGFAPNESSKEEISRLANNKVEFAREIHDKKYNIADALLKISNGTPWKDVPFEFLIENIPHLQARYYSISSSSMSEKKSIHVTAVVEAEEIEGQLVTGVVTNLLKHIEIVKNKSSSKPIVTYDLKGPHGKFLNFKLPIHVRRSTFKLPSNPGVPVILIGPGTGVAPFRGFVRERIVQHRNGNNIGKTLLFYGCRTEDEDFLYKDEWQEYSKELGSSFEMVTAFSRQTSKKVYVQDKLLENASAITRLIDEGAYIYVCGDASRMARDVQSTLQKIISNARGISDEKGIELIRSFKVQNRYQEDVW